ncbi:response receiver [Powellomyces hirtus]|nr:response receiver [Powellomyces hirtus]
MSSCSDFDPHNPLGLRILAAEDNMLCQKVLAQILKKLGCAVTIASDGMEAVRTWQENTEGFDAVLMDIRMPNMDGITATRLLREKGCAIPIIAVTAERGEAERQKCLLVGMNSFLSKPLLIKDLVTRLRDLC